MSMTIQVRGERGDALVTYYDLRGQFMSAIEGVYYCNRIRYEAFTILRYIDAYGMTVLNRLQLAPFLVELDQLADVFVGDAGLESLTQTIRGLAEFCHDHVHTYLWFDGD
jgi:hypothetical protein